MTDLSNVEITISMECDVCKGIGGYNRQPGPLVFDKNDILNQNTKDVVFTPEQVQKDLDKIPKEVPGFTDKVVFIQCLKCRGSGKIKNKITLEELKKILP